MEELNFTDLYLKKRERLSLSLRWISVDTGYLDGYLICFAKNKTKLESFNS